MFFQILFLRTNLFTSIYVIPYIYFIYILWFPMKMNHLLVYILSFFIGLLMDGITGTYGLHALACLIVSFYRNQFLLNVIRTKRELVNEEPSTTTLNSNFYSSYIIISCILHNIIIIGYYYIFNKDFIHYVIEFICTTAFEIISILFLDLFRRKKSYY